MNTWQYLGSIIVFVGSLFVLYRLFVRVLNERIEFLKDKIESQTEVSSRISNIEKFHEYEIKNLQVALKQAIDQKEEEKEKLIEQKIKEIQQKDVEVNELRNELNNLNKKIESKEDIEARIEALRILQSGIYQSMKNPQDQKPWWAELLKPGNKEGPK